MARNKVTVIGAGNVGATTAQRIAEAGLADVVLVDIVEGLPQGKGLDLAEAAPVVGHDARVTGTNDYADTAGSRHRRRHLRAGPPAGHEPRRPAGQERRHRPRASSSRPRAVSPDAILIIVTNPLDAMCHVAMQASGFPRERVLGHGRRPRLGPLPDVHRRRSSACRVEDTHAFVLGGHGDTMVPLSRYSTVAGVPITELLPAERVKALEERTAQRRRRDRRAAQDRLGVLRAGRVARSRWSSRSCSTASASCPAPSCSRASSASTACSSACRSSSARAGSSASSRSS